MESAAILFLAVAITVVSLQGEADAAALSERARRSVSAVSPMATLPDGTMYRDLETCDLVTCPRVDLSDCELKEVIIWKVGPSRFCRFCEYCLDWPFRAAAAKARRRRSVPLLTNEDQLLQALPEVQESESVEADGGNRLKRSSNLMSLLQSHLTEISVGHVNAQSHQGHSRNTRASDNLPEDQIFDVLCPYVRCPVAPPNRTCQHTETVEGWIRGRKCVRCATCVDDVTSSASRRRYGHGQRRTGGV